MPANHLIDPHPYIQEIDNLSISETDALKQLGRLKSILERLCRELTRDEAMQFSNLFSRLVYIAQKYKIPKRLEWQLQHFRVQEKELRNESSVSQAVNLYLASVKAIKELLQIVSGTSEPQSTEVTSPADTEGKTETPSAYPSTLRVQLLKYDRESGRMRCSCADFEGAVIIAQYPPTAKNDFSNADSNTLYEGAQLNLIDCETNVDGAFTPRLIVLEPDYLIDASALAECFQDYLVTPCHYFRNKFSEKENRSYLLLGNLANFFLDELIFAENPEQLSFNEVFLRSFKQSPFEYSSCRDIQSDDNFRQFMWKAKNQFENIRRVVCHDFPKQGIDIHQCILEPSFYSEKYGFQGRLDLLQLHAEHEHAKIVELKSGRLPYPASDNGKIAPNHGVQTAIYRMMIEGVFGLDTRAIDAAILYSAGDEPGINLRFAAKWQELERYIVEMRNMIVAYEQAVVRGNNQTVEGLFLTLFSTVTSANRLPNFYRNRISDMQNMLAGCSELETAYFYRFVRFVSHELYLQKIGDVAYETPTGLAALWNSDFSERLASLDALSDLSIKEIDDSGHDMTILFSRKKEDEAIANFRVGEICIVYPRSGDQDTVLNRQILKGTLVRINGEVVEVRFRYKQRNHLYFHDHPLWAIEHDSLDSSLNNMYRSLYAFMGASTAKKELLLGLRPPHKPEVRKTTNLAYQDRIIQEAVDAEEYFLIVGPPGTGKTSIFARRLIEEYYRRPDCNIMVLAYTNRAVDELCEAIHAALGCDEKACNSYIRVGSELSCAPPYRERLLQKVADKAPNRASLLAEIEKTRIYVATLAAIQGRMEIFTLKHFHLALIDEASQILEPQLIGILPQFDKFILIGDHNQLATITLQQPQASQIEEDTLREVGFMDCRDSLFERLIRRIDDQGWGYAATELVYQGRMHEHIAAFPSQQFYSGKLYPACEWQSDEWELTPGTNNMFQVISSKWRTAFVSTENLPHDNLVDKTNMVEASIIAHWLHEIRDLYLFNGKVFDPACVGIIAPYRNQIALIRNKLETSNFEGLNEVMIDTVERFQGSQRDIIFLSFCVNAPYQLQFLANLNHDATVDRKLNVAITRARQQLFLVGNASILSLHPVYSALLSYYRKEAIIVEPMEKNLHNFSLL